MTPEYPVRQFRGFRLRRFDVPPDQQKLEAVKLVTRRPSPESSRSQLGTALLEVSIADQYVPLGQGCFMRIELPPGAFPDLDIEEPAGKARAAALINSLNKLELEQVARRHCLGAWCMGESGPAHASFYPSCVDKYGRLSWLYMFHRVRAEWGGGFLSSGGIAWCGTVVTCPAECATWQFTISPVGAVVEAPWG